MHYVTSPTFDDNKPTLLLFHGNPDSVTGFRELLNNSEAKGAYNFMAFDYFGCGSSDDCVAPACLDPDTSPSDAHHFVTIPEFVGVVKEVVADHKVTTQLVCMGYLKGSQVAVECGKQFGSRVLAMMLIAPVWFDPDVVKIVEKYTLHTRNVEIRPDGQEYLDAWHQPSVAPCDQVNGSYCGVWTPKNLELNHLKTLNRIRAFQTQWQLILAGLGTNDDLVNRTLIKSIAAKHVYIGWPETGVEVMWPQDGFKLDSSLEVNYAWGNATGGSVVIDYVALANEGTMAQNASHYAKQLYKMISTRKEFTV